MKIKIKKQIQGDLPKNMVNINVVYQNENKEIAQLIDYITKYKQAILVQKDFLIEGVSYKERRKNDGKE